MSIYSGYQIFDNTYSVSFSSSNFSTSFLSTLITSFEAWASSLNAAIISAVWSLYSQVVDVANDPMDFTCPKFGRLGDAIPPKEPELLDLFSLNDLRILLRALNINEHRNHYEGSRLNWNYILTCYVFGIIRLECLLYISVIALKATVSLAI